MPNTPLNGRYLKHSAIGHALRLSALFVVLLSSSVIAQDTSTDFPALTGRVVDQAGLLDEQTEATLTTTLAAHETETSNQIVVVTLPSLNGYDISDYANRLGRHWEIGTAEEDNGVLLVVAPNDRKVRIEVGYGLEGALTDSLSSVIIQREILPEFRNNDYPKGIEKGVAAITQAIEGEYTAPANSSSKGAGKTDAFSAKYGNYVPLIFIAIIGLSEFLKRKGFRKAYRGAFPAGFSGLFITLASGNLFIGLAIAAAVFLFIYIMSSGGSGGSGGTRTRGYPGVGGSSGGFGGGGFSGGGGSFGGGGASGSW